MRDQTIVHICFSLMYGWGFSLGNFWQLNQTKGGKMKRHLRESRRSFALSFSSCWSPTTKTKTIITTIIKIIIMKLIQTNQIKKMNLKREKYFKNYQSFSNRDEWDANFASTFEVPTWELEAETILAFAGGRPTFFYIFFLIFF